MLSTEGMPERYDPAGEGRDYSRYNPHLSSIWSLDCNCILGCPAFPGTCRRIPCLERKTSTGNKGASDCCQKFPQVSITNNGLERMPSHNNEVKLCHPTG